MQPTKITNQNLVQLLLEDASRNRVLKRYQNAKDKALVFVNHLTTTAAEINLSLEEATLLKKALLNTGETGTQILEAFIPNPSFPTPLLYELYEEQKCLTALAHKSGPIDLLLKIGRTIEGQEEALLTVGKHYYNNKAISKAEFQTFLEEFSDSEWLLTALIHSVREQNEKAKILAEIIHKQSNNQELKALYQELQIEQELMITKDKALIKTKHKTKNPRFLRAIAQNTATPLKILLSLKKVNRVKYAGSIRAYAVETLAKIKAQ